MSFLDFPGLQYFYNKYLKPIKPHAREETIKSYTVNEQGHVPDAQLVVQLKEENESLQEEIEKLNSALVFAPRYDTLVDGSSFNKNFLAIYLPAHENRLNAANYFSKPAEDSEWRNIPPAMSGKLWLGYRTPQRMGAANELVVIMEHYPVAGRIWTNYYNSGTWKGWKNVSPE